MSRAAGRHLHHSIVQEACRTRVIMVSPRHTGYRGRIAPIRQRRLTQGRVGLRNETLHTASITPTVEQGTAIGVASGPLWELAPWVSLQDGQLINVPITNDCESSHTIPIGQQSAKTEKVVTDQIALRAMSTQNESVDIASTRARQEMQRPTSHYEPNEKDPNAQSTP